MISVTILVKNGAETLATTLDSCRRFPEVLIYDTGSCDTTLAIARLYPNVRIVERPFEGFGPCHNKASLEATHDWILSLDSDEVLTPELVDEIFSLSLDPQLVYAIHRRNYMNQKPIRFCCGWYPDWNVRLFFRKTTQFTDALVHETVQTDGLTICRLKQEMLHTPYRSIEQLLHKMQTYSSLFAEQNRGKKQSSLTKALLHGLAAFFRNYVLKRGFLGGKEGFIISLYNAQVTYYKYLKLAWRSNSS
jgi:glycosyltransferase involved in cell wall biosynthesis